MDVQVKCGFCGTSNVSSVFACSACFMPLVDESPLFETATSSQAEASHSGTGASPAAPPPPPEPLAPLGPYTGPAGKQAAVEDGAAEPAEPLEETSEAPTDAGPTGLSPLPGYRIGGNVIAGRDAVESHAPLRPMHDPNRVAWRWYHVIVIGLLAWGVPLAVEWGLGIDRSISALLTRGMAVQIVGYLLGALAVGGWVWTRQQGDWSTLGLGDDARQGRRDLLRGVVMGLAMFAGYLPVGLFTSGRLSVDGIVRVLLGNVDGIGLVLTAAVVIIGAPVVEEIFFRGMLYEKIARRTPVIAVVVTSILFMLAHGGIIVQIFLLGLAFGIRRMKGESVWFTMGAHAAWNASVIILGLVLLSGGPVLFKAPSGGFELRYPKDYTRQENLELSAGPMRISLALQGSDGSGMSVAEIDGINAGTGSGEQMLKFVKAARVLPEVSDIRKSDIPFDDAATAYEMDARAVSSLSYSMNSRIVAVVPPGSTTLYLFELDCMSPACDAATKDFEQMLYSVVFHDAPAAAAP